MSSSRHLIKTNLPVTVVVGADVAVVDSALVAVVLSTDVAVVDPSVLKQYSSCKMLSLQAFS
jgi:hypothetical protein